MVLVLGSNLFLDWYKSWYFLVYINIETSIRLVHTKLVLHQVPSPHQAATDTRLVGYVSRHTSLVGSLLMLILSHLNSHIRVLRKVTLSSPCLWAAFHPLCPLFNEVRKVKKFLFNLGMKCWNSAFNTQGSRYILILVVQVGAVKIYAAAVDALRKKGWKEGVKTGWNSVSYKTWCISEFQPLPSPPLLRHYCRNFFCESHPVLDQTQGSNFRCCISTTFWKTLLHVPIDEEMFVWQE